MAMPVRLTFYPLQFPHDDWQEIYAQIGMDFEVMLITAENVFRSFSSRESASLTASS